MRAHKLHHEPYRKRCGQYNQCPKTQQKQHSATTQQPAQDRNPSKDKGAKPLMLALQCQAGAKPLMLALQCQAGAAAATAHYCCSCCSSSSGEAHSPIKATGLLLLLHRDTPHGVTQL